MKKIAAIHDLSGYGRASLTVAIPILTHMGFQVCPLPTAILSAHLFLTGKSYNSSLTLYTRAIWPR